VSLAHESKKYAPKSSKESNEPQHSIAIAEKVYANKIYCNFFLII